MPSLDLMLDRDASAPLVDQLRDQVARAIRLGELPPGHRLPSTRDAASRFRVNRQTVVAAYRRLEADGLLELKRGAGAYVRHVAPSIPARRPRGERASQALLAHERRAAAALAASPPATGAVSAAGEPLDLGGLSPHERGYPAGAFSDAMLRALERRGHAALGYGPSGGDPELREILAERLRARGLAADASALVVVGGAQQGLDLLFRALLDPGDTVVTEAPTYHMGLDLLAFHRARVAPVRVRPGRAQDGAQAGALATLDFDALSLALEQAPSLAYVMPTCQNPTGLTLDLPTRVRLVSMLRDAGVLLVEDDYEAGMLHSGEPLPLACSLPQAGETVYLGTLSKALFPGLRIGWLAGDPATVARVAQVKRVTDLSGSLVLQAAATELLRSGAYDAHVATHAREAGERMRALVAALEPLLPEGCALTRPLGGHVLWLQAPASSGRAIAARAARLGVIVTPGESFEAEPQGAAVRVSIARIEPRDVPRAAELLARSVHEAMKESRGRSRAGEMDRPVTM